MNMYYYINVIRKDYNKVIDKVGSLIVKCRHYALYDFQRWNVQ